MEDEYFHCENCNGELVAESDKLAAQELGDADDNARRRRREKLKEMLQKIEEQLRPLVEQVNRIKDFPVPEFGTLQAWEARASAAARLAGDNSNDPSRSAQHGTPMPFLGDTKVEVALSGVQAKEDSKSETNNTPMKVLPPWMIKQGMNLTKEQRGEVKEEVKMEGSSAPLEDDKKSNVEKDAKTIEEEYIAAYYAAINERRRQQEEAAKQMQESSSGQTSDQDPSLERQVGVKSKREDEDEDELEWEEAAPSGNTGESYKVNDLNVQADAPAEEEEEGDDVEWEEG